MYQRRNRLVWRIFSQRPVVKTTSGAYVATPPTTFAHGESDRRDHADYREKADYGIKVTCDKICQQYPIKRKSFLRQGAEETFLRHKKILTNVINAAKLRVGSHKRKYTTKILISL